MVIFLAGLGVLYLGADWLVKGSARLARILHITPLAIGLTVVSFGTSAPELVVSVVAAVKKEADIALGNVIGSNIANIGLILGVSAVITALKCNVKTVKREVPIMIGVSFLLLLLSLDGKITFLDGLILFSGIIAFTLYNYLSARKEALEISPDVEEKYVNLLSSPQLKLSRSL
ncbi:MAG: sodium:calcium antiporter, partial [Fidelibacterota bacterium]